MFFSSVERHFTMTEFLCVVNVGNLKFILRGWCLLVYNHSQETGRPGRGFSSFFPISAKHIPQ
jgi:hypothetical protein